MAKRIYSDQEKAAYLLALKANGGNLKRTSRETGVPLATLFHWRQGDGVNSDVSDIANQKAESLAEKFERVANLLVDRLAGFIDHERTTLSMVATAAGIAVDKARLLRNEPTLISSSVELTDDERRARITAIFDRARARRAG